jgi:hypothetical protein
MALSQYEQNQIIDAIKQRFPQMPRCSFCSNNNWTLADGYITLTLQEDLSSYNIGGPSLPSVALICNHCGKTELMNLLMLGLSHLVEAKRQSSVPSTRMI